MQKNYCLFPWRFWTMLDKCTWSEAVLGWSVCRLATCFCSLMWFWSWCTVPFLFQGGVFVLCPLAAVTPTAVPARAPEHARFSLQPLTRLQLLLHCLWTVMNHVGVLVSGFRTSLYDPQVSIETVYIRVASFAVVQDQSRDVFFSRHKSKGWTFPRV